ncbi:MAG TPA: hypothetical protein VKP65_07415 [Rhodothermales bacterium]|nr:hypothetical protein [Rhodothermales bacterium]
MSRLVPIFGLLLLLALVGCDSGTSMDEPDVMGPVETRISVALLTTALEGGLRETEVHLNNYGQENEERAESWYRSNDAYIRLGPNLGGSEIRFDIPESRSARGPFRFLYYVRDVNIVADSVAVTLPGGPQDLLLTVRFPFEEDGTEFKGHCLTSSGGGCLGSKDSIAPDIQLGDAYVDVLLVPTVAAGALTFDVVDVQFVGDVQAGGFCNINLGFIAFDLCDALGSYKDQITTEITTTVFSAFSEGDLQGQVAAGIQPFLTAFGIGDILSLRRDGAELIIVHQPRLAM